jgi:hypothetical protein
MHESFEPRCNGTDTLIRRQNAGSDLNFKLGPTGVAWIQNIFYHTVVPLGLEGQKS